MLTLSGRCLCGAITFEIPAPARFDVCHCVDCRRWHGTSPVGIDLTDVTLTSGASALTWYRSSSLAERGFCSTCGSSLFYRMTTNPARWSCYLGALENVPRNIGLGSQHFEQQRPAQYRVVSMP
ncbi:GFA family protein [Yoonia sp. SDW83-1]|uniref:GFA family protein n=1 Tax=Yoonia sp. SDW83-1 TaxID=3366945 RepID=UPI00398C43F2